MATTQRQRRTLVVLAIAVLLLGLLGACGAWLTRDEKPARPGALAVVGAGGVEVVDAKGRAPYAASGRVDQLRPGALQTLEVTVSNPDAVDYRILDLTARAGDANADCGATRNLVISSYDADKPGAVEYVVPAGASITVPLAVMMLDTPDSQDGCKDVTFPLSFSGTASQGSGDS